MHRTWTLLSSLAVAVSIVGTIACSSTSPTPPPPTVSFANDVMPILQSGCGISSVCHGQMNNTAEESLYLGDHRMTGDTTPAPKAMVDAVYQGIVGVKSKEDPAMNIVTAGDTSQSYMFHKLVPDPDSLAQDCNKVPLCSMCSTTHPCGVAMPQNTMGWGVDEPAFFATIQNWISQGAKNN